jgi:hypothetical protein
MRNLGGDPTALTPAANIEAVASSGVPKVLADARTTFVECLDAILAVELLDNDCWEALIDLADRAGEEELMTQFASALADEQEHLVKVRGWLAALRAK